MFRHHPFVTAYGYFSFGWLVGMCVEKITGKEFSNVVQDLISQPLGVATEMYMGDVASRAVDVTRIAAVENSMYKEAFGGEDKVRACVLRSIARAVCSC